MTQNHTKKKGKHPKDGTSCVSSFYPPASSLQIDAFCPTHRRTSHGTVILRLQAFYQQAFVNPPKEKRPIQCPSRLRPPIHQLVLLQEVPPGPKGLRFQRPQGGSLLSKRTRKGGAEVEAETKGVVEPYNMLSNSKRVRSCS